MSSLSRQSSELGADAYEIGENSAANPMQTRLSLCGTVRTWAPGEEGLRELVGRIG